MSGDYTQAKLLFRIEKAIRYIRIFGLSRTLIKIKGQYHMKANENFAGSKWINEDCRVPESSARTVAILGCGNYAFSNIAYYLNKESPHFLRSTFDINRARSLSLCRSFGGLYAIADWRDIISDPKVKLVYIASNHATHAEYAVSCIEAGKSVHIEKPHVVSQEQLDRLTDAMRRNPEVKVFLGFNRPKSRLFEKLQFFLGTETGPLMINWFVAGHEISNDHWYFDEKEGGRVLGNLCHWTDLTLHLISMKNAFPCTIVSATPPSAKSDFVVSIVFADRSCASITFSAKGHTFEGVRETLNIHKGNVLANLTDFGSLTVDVVEKKHKINSLFRDHGHEMNILNSLRAVQAGHSGERIAYVSATARLFLAVRQAIETGEKVELAVNDYGKDICDEPYSAIGFTPSRPTA